MVDLVVSENQIIERILTMELVRVTERAAVASARLRGKGNEKAADQAAVDAMRRELNKLPIDGEVVIGEGERDEAPMLFIGEKVGTKRGPKVDIAVDPLEGTTLCAKDMPGSIAVMAMAQAGTLLNAPDVYMDKIAIGPGYKKGVVDLDLPPEENIRALAKAKGVKPREINALVMDRPRHEKLIAALRKVGIGAAPEGVLAAGALRCVGGQMQGRLQLDTPAKIERARGMGISDPKRKYGLTDLCKGDTVVALTGVTDGGLVKGVKFRGDVIETDTLIYRSTTGTVRRILGEHREMQKFAER
jgi:fructose-1,6-bisphosphatase II / sedoheptulose-1,7-bisphosphatase